MLTTIIDEVRMEVYTQSRADTRPQHYRIWAAIGICGGIAFVYAVLQQHGLLGICGLLGIGVSSIGLFVRRSTSLPILTDGMQSIPTTYVEETRVISPENASDRATYLVDELVECDEVGETVIRPTPDGSGEFVEAQLNGPYVSRRLKQAITSVDGTPRMRPFETEEYYRLYIRLD